MKHYLPYKNIVLAPYLFLVYCLLPIGQAFADGTGNNPTGTGNTTGSTETNASSAVEPVRLENPLGGNIDSLPELVKSLLNIVLIIGTPIVALAIIYAGFMLVAAQGNPEKLSKARQALLWAVVGGAILLGSYILAQAIGGTVEQLTS